MRILLATAAVIPTVLPASANVTPALAWSSNDVDYSQDVCRERARAALAREGWERIHPSGAPALAVAAFIGPLAAVILCVDRAIGADHAVAVIFVTGGENGQPEIERDRLQYFMRD